MTTHGYAEHVHKKRSFLSTLAWGISGVLMTVLVCATTVALYAMNIVDRKTDTLTGFVRETIRTLPDLIDALPPAMADVLEDRRMPGYVDSIEVTAKLIGSERPGRHGYWIRPVIEVQNHGDEMVSLLSMHVVVLNEDGDPVDEMNEWAATPFAADDCWRGPLLPGATRRIVAGHVYLRDAESADHLRVEVEITDLRVWKGNATDAVAAADPSGAEVAIARAGD